MGDVIEKLLVAELLINSSCGTNSTKNAFSGETLSYFCSLDVLTFENFERQLSRTDLSSSASVLSAHKR